MIIKNHIAKKHKPRSTSTSTSQKAQATLWHSGLAVGHKLSMGKSLDRTAGGLREKRKRERKKER